VASDSIIPITKQNSWGFTYQIKRILGELKNKRKEAV